MKPQDLLILYHALNCKSKNLPLSSINFRSFAWDLEDVQAAQKRLQHVGLLDRKTSQPDLDRIKLFLLEALSFWWPAGKVISGQGLALAMSRPSAASKSQQLVWPLDGEYSEGEVVRPLWPELPKLASKDRELHEFFSWIEVLRFEKHSAKSSAQQCVVRFLDKVQTLGSQNYPDTEQAFLDLKEAQFATLVNFISHNGYKSMTMQKASLLTHLPFKYFMERWETDQALRLWIAGKYQEQVFQFLDPLAEKIHSMNKGHLAVVLEDILNYLEGNEDFYRMHLWSYLENDVAIQEMCRRHQKSFFESVLTLFKKSKSEAAQKAELYSYLFTSLWRVYAAFSWMDSKTLKNSAHIATLKRDIRNFIIHAVFEDY